MLVVRLAQAKDLNALEALAHSSGGGLTTLPTDRAVLQKKLNRALQTHAQPDQTGDGLFWLVMQDSHTGDIVGVSGIECALGLQQTCYTYRVGTIVHASGELNVYHRFPTLFLTNDHTGCSELCSLYLHPDYRHSKAGALLSKARFLLMAQIPKRFSSKVIAEMRGYLNEQGQSPFWEGLGRHFFDMDFSKADSLSAITNKQFIAELMPRYPFYTNFLSREAQSVIGEVHPETLPAKAMLEHEGFRYEGCVDIFDAGPTLECYVDRVRGIRDSYLATLLQVESLSGYPVLVSNLDMRDFRCALFMPSTQTENNSHPQNVSSLWKLLHLSEQDKARCVSLKREGA